MDAQKLARYLEFRPAWKSFSVYVFGALIFFIGPLINPDAPIRPALAELIGTCFVVFIIIKRFTNIYRLSADKLTHETSFPKHALREVALEDIRRIDLRRGLTQRALGVAHVHVYVQGREDPAIKIFGVAEPDKFKGILMELGAQDERITGAWRR
ncbi:hypothetical protein AAU61_01495 [Desulfocarbo indianensis]|nr:hypothetical protein AAU61_01495 [Desulfocarbo indianensis]